MTQWTADCRHHLPEDVLRRIARAHRAAARPPPLVPELQTAPSTAAFSYYSGWTDRYPFEVDGATYVVDASGNSRAFSVWQQATDRVILQCRVMPDHLRLCARYMTGDHAARGRALLTALFRIMARHGIALGEATTFRLAQDAVHLADVPAHRGVRGLLAALLALPYAPLPMFYLGPSCTEASRWDE